MNHKIDSQGRASASWFVLGGAIFYGFAMIAATRIQIVIAALVVLNLIGLTIAAYRIMRKK